MGHKSRRNKAKLRFSLSQTMTELIKIIQHTECNYNRVLSLQVSGVFSSVSYDLPVTRSDVTIFIFHLLLMKLKKTHINASVLISSKWIFNMQLRKNGTKYYQGAIFCHFAKIIFLWLNWQTCNNNAAENGSKSLIITMLQRLFVPVTSSTVK